MKTCTRVESIPRGTQPAFSLVELLVVVSVIALLLGVLLPGLASAREAGNMAVCATNLDQLDGHVDTLAPREAGELANNQEYALP